jgi:hypothetical protein
MLAVGCARQRIVLWRMMRCHHLT